MDNIAKLYNSLIENSRSKFGNTHGLQILHQGKHTDENSILFIGRENRGHGNKIANFKQPVTGFIKNDFGWLNDSYKFTGSPFWRVIGKALSKITCDPYDAKIFEKIYWTNIYKISPHERKPNTKKVRDFQSDICCELILEEIRYIQPKGVVFLTDDWLWDYLGKWKHQNAISTWLKDNSKTCFNLSFSFLTENGDIPALVLPHPQNTRSGASESDLINYISKAVG